MTVLLGGRVAEQLVFGAVTTGAANDLQRVDEITHAMVHEYAMGTRTTRRARRSRTEAVSDLTRRIRDEEQQELAFEAPPRTRTELITAHRATLDAVRRRAARARGARARRDRPHHGRRAAHRPPPAASRRRCAASAATRRPTDADADP